MKQLYLARWTLRFSCVLFLVLAVFFARYIDQIEKQNQLSILSAGHAANLAARASYDWQQKASESLLVLAQKLKDEDYYDMTLSEIDGFTALFVTDPDGVVRAALPRTLTESFFGVASQHTEQPFTEQMPDPPGGSAVALPFDRYDGRYILYALISEQQLSAALGRQSKARIILLNENGKVIMDNAGLAAKGTNFTLQEADGYRALGGGFFQNAGGNQHVVLARMGSRGFFDWTVCAELPIKSWHWGYTPVYLSAIISLVALLLSLLPGTPDSLPPVNTHPIPEAKRAMIKTRMKKILDANRSE